MNNLKKIGLSALAGSLAAISANAVELSVTGKTELTYVTKDKGHTGNPFGMGNGITFSGSGDMNGMTATYTAVLGDGAQANSNNSETFASSSLMIDMGDMGTVGFDQGVGEFGVGTIDDKTPYAYEEQWTNLGTSNGLRAAGGTNVIGYKNSYAGYNVTLELDPGHTGNSSVGSTGDGGATGAGTTDAGYNFAITSSPATGFNAGAGYGTESNGAVNSKDASFLTGYVTYAIGGATLGFQMSDASGGATGAVGNQVMIAGVSYSVNENLAVSFSKMENEYANGTSLTAASGSVANAVIGKDTTEDTTGIGASYTMGSAAVRVLASQGTSIGGTAGNDEDHVEVSLMLAF